MKKPSYLHIMALVCFIFTASMSFARDYIIYSIVQELPMGEENELLKKNFYVNMGSQQGIESGTTLDVYRVISRANPFETKQKYNHKVKIGELEILHSEEHSSIANLKNYNDDSRAPLFETEALIIGDHVSVQTK